MELLHVWIEKYRNIEKQGFNFSPCWRFDYNPETGYLDIEDRNQQVVNNFFGDRISNVTAIVGANGSGKTTLMSFVANRLSQGIGFWNEPFIFIFNIKSQLIAYAYYNLSLSYDDLSFDLTHRQFKMRERGDGMRGGLRPIVELDELTGVYLSHFFSGEPPVFTHQISDLSPNGVIYDLLKEQNKSKNSLPANYKFDRILKQGIFIQSIGDKDSKVLESFNINIPTYLIVVPPSKMSIISMTWELSKNAPNDNDPLSLQMKIINYW